jgi:tungstate transport system ATP-binding protein
MSALLKLKKIGKAYDGKIILRDISLDVKKGEILYVIGPNGAGKTTLLKIMALLENPSAGEIFHDGTKVKASDAGCHRKKVTMVFQQTVLFKTTVFGNVSYGLKLRGYSKEEIEKRTERALESVKLEGFGRRKAKKISGGEQQRVALARALVTEPELLLLDEPTANLDPANITLVEDIIRGLKGKTTVVVATHNLFHARRMADRVACILDGELIDIGKTKEIFGRPKDERTKKFIRGEFF